MGYQYVKQRIDGWRLGEVSLVEALTELEQHLHDCREVRRQLTSLPFHMVTPAVQTAATALADAISVLAALSNAMSNDTAELHTLLTFADRTSERVQTCRLALQLEEGVGTLSLESATEIAPALELVDMAYSYLLQAGDDTTSLTQAVLALQQADTWCMEALESSWQPVV